MQHLPWPTALDWGHLHDPGPQTESSRERGYLLEGDEAELGHVDLYDPNDLSDVADEGPGHRG